MAVDEISQNMDGKGLHIGIVIARFNEYAGRGEYKYCLEELKRFGVAEEDITVCHVPGALEIPFALQQMAQTGEYDALIAFGAVIRGETYHFELVANESAAGISRVALDFDIPIANGVLTTEDDEQCEDRIEGKGKACAAVAVEMANLAAEFPAYGDEDSDEAEDDEDFEEKADK
ncbi:MAG: 6,7-dimethyl-8-ribityllumazine synthase [Sutterellaceae bacterium]|nr:6,7-dimethyl-8-ribityllumazine synthase [Sutterellaceae bacterium]MDD7442191.1 6,7-dimethyl-8-ribityllumazine synthase [Sutterellaceae bacterium]MDY2868186.1 6,7-dimethyl-8-ribityllumazine synthase [Mesosutterella sp.]